MTEMIKGLVTISIREEDRDRIDKIISNLDHPVLYPDFFHTVLGIFDVVERFVALDGKEINFNGEKVEL